METQAEKSDKKEKKESKLWLALLLGVYTVIVCVYMNDLFECFKGYKEYHVTTGPGAIFINLLLEYPFALIPLFCLISVASFYIYDRYDKIKPPYNLLVLTVFITFLNLIVYSTATCYVHVGVYPNYGYIGNKIYHWLWYWF